MKILKFNNEKSWLEARLGRVTGTKLGKLVSKRDGNYLTGFYEIIAERVAIPANQENVMDRGRRLEDEAVERFKELTKKKVVNDLVIWTRDDDENMAYSPDGSIGKTEAVEVKCLSSASHIEAWHKKEIPSEYETQILQAFIVNEKLKRLYFVFYDPRMPIDIFWITVERKGIKELIEKFFEIERRVLKEIDELEKKLTF